MKNTPEQQLAIDTENTNIIVSAGAGSGKTAVLTQRVIRKLLNGAKINELLILTFTNNAAAEMKERIKGAILKNETIKDQANLVDSADITTFDSYTLALVKKYYYYLNLNPKISITDSSIITKKKKDIINEIILNLHKNKDEEWEYLASLFGTKNNNYLKQTILELDNKIDLLTEKEDFLNNYVENYYNINNINYLFNEYEKQILEKKNTIKTILFNLSYEVSDEYYEKISNSLEHLLNVNNYEELRSSLLDINIPRISNSTEKGKLLKKQISEIVKELKEESITSKELHISNLMDTKKLISPIIKVLTILNKQISEYKLKNNLFEFNDISKFAIKLIKEYDDIKLSLKYQYKEIMIDEYQDTSDIQEEFINLLENNNVYMVGDVKQSIYRFRNANPNIFKIKYDLYKKNIKGVKIDLNANFRSRSEVLISINNIFDHIMDNEIGNANYKEEHRLIPGNKTFNEIGFNNQNNNLEIYNYKENELYSKEEIEAFIIANDIKEKINNKYLVFDKELRPCEYRDFCILMDRTTTFDIYKKIFNYLQIPLNIDKDDDILLSEEVLIINNIIGLILDIKNKTNTKMKFYYTSIARSYLYNLSDQIIYDTITNNKIYESEIYQKCFEISKEIDYINNVELLNLIITKFNFYEKMILAGNTLYHTTILENLKNKFSELSKAEIRINQINEYLESLIKDNEKIKIPTPKNKNNSVIITNIHKSKGLEYKICYYSGLYKTFNKMDIQKRIIYSEDYGFILPAYREGFINTFVHYLNTNKYNIDEISEKLRLFYVALTRAKEKMIMVTSLKEDVLECFDENEMVDYLTRSHYKSFSDILDSTLKYIKPYVVNIDDYKVDLNYKNNLTYTLENIPKVEPLLVNELEDNNILVNENHYSKNNKELISNEEYNKMNYGTHIHYILENLDFLNPDFTLYNENELYIINNLLHSDLFKNIKNAKIYKEYEFIIDDNNTSKHGIIDLMLEYNDHIDIVDYKLKSIEDDAYIKQLKGYQDYTKTKTNKNVNIYLYSLIDAKLKSLN